MKMSLAALFLVLTALLVQADRFDAWDRNKDGFVQMDELPHGMRRSFSRLDTNGDGLISRAECAAFLQGRRAEQRPGGPERRVQTDGYRVLKDIDYVGAGNPRQALDLFLPEGESDEARPLLVFIHGGAWRAGSKDGAFRRLKPFLDSGSYAGAAINYRLTGEAPWPAQIHDCKAAIRWLKAHAPEHGYDPAKVAVWGTSAGGHLVAVLGVSGDVPELEGKLGDYADQSSTVACVVDYFGPANLVTMAEQPSKMDHGGANSPEGRLVGGAIKERLEVAQQASPVTHVTKNDVPFLIAHGSKDPTVPHEQSVEMAEALKEAGVPVTFITMTEAGHGFRSEELDRRVAQFLANHLLGQSEEISDKPIPADGKR